MAFEELKQRQSVAWGAAPFERIADEIGDIHDHLVAELAPKSGDAWLDVATGTGGVAVRAARAGANVTGVDLAPNLIETAKRLAAEEGLTIRYEVGDAEMLPCADASFDVVSSSFGVMFAPDQQGAARELARVCRSGGRIGLSTWDPQGGIRGRAAALLRDAHPAGRRHGVRPRRGGRDLRQGPHPHAGLLQAPRSD